MCVCMCVHVCVRACPSRCQAVYCVLYGFAVVLFAIAVFRLGGSYATTTTTTTTVSDGSFQTRRLLIAHDFSTFPCVAGRYNIAVCLAPTIVSNETDSGGGADVSALMEMPRVLKIVEFLIVHLDDIVERLQLEKTFDDAEMSAALREIDRAGARSTNVSSVNLSAASAASAASMKPGGPGVRRGVSGVRFWVVRCGCLCVCV